MKNSLGKLLKKLTKHFDFAQIKRKNVLLEIMKFSSQLLKELTKNCTETSNNFREKLQRNPQEMLEIFGVFLKICPGALQTSGTEYGFEGVFDQSSSGAGL